MNLKPRSPGLTTLTVALHDLILMLGKVGYELHGSNLCGNPSPNQTRRWKRMEDPRPGDLVIELSTACWWLQSGNPHPGPYDYLKVENAIGFLEKIVEEPIENAEQWEKDNEEPAPLEKVFYIKKLHDDEVFRWTNARFVTILPVEGWPR